MITTKYQGKFFVKVTGLLLVISTVVCGSQADSATTSYEINRQVRASYRKLIKTNPSARMLADKAKAVLIFPSITKGGFMFGGQYGKGALIKDGVVDSYYKSYALSYGFQAGIQQFGYAMFFMTEDDLDYLNRSSGWEVGVGPSIVFIDEGMARTMTSTTLKDGVYAFVYGQEGLMAGAGLQGTKITQIYPVE